MQKNQMKLKLKEANYQKQKKNKNIYNNKKVTSTGGKCEYWLSANLKSFEHLIINRICQTFN